MRFLRCLYDLPAGAITASVLLSLFSSSESKGEKAITTAESLTKPLPKYIKIALERPHHKATFRVEVARTAHELKSGLMNRKSLSHDSGMLFIFPSARIASFWMKDTFIPLDIIFIEEKGSVVQYHEGANPLSLDVITSKVPVKYALELPAGSVQQHIIRQGDRLIHLPSLKVWEQ